MFASFYFKILSFFFLLQGLYQVFLETRKNFSDSHIKRTLKQCSILLLERLSCFVIMPHSLNGKWILLSYFLADPANLLNQIHWQNPIQHSSSDKRTSKNSPDFTVMAPKLYQPHFEHRLMEKTIQTPLCPQKKAMKSVHDTATVHSVPKLKKPLVLLVFHGHSFTTLCE